MTYHKGATQIDQCAHRLMEYQISPDWHGSTIVGDYIAYYHEEKLYTVRHLKKGVSCLVYARSPYDAIEKVRAMESPVPPHWRPVVRGKWKYISFMTVKCSNCQETFQELAGDNFCPNCGADMRAEEGE